MSTLFFTRSWRGINFVKPMFFCIHMSNFFYLYLLTHWFWAFWVILAITNKALKCCQNKFFIAKITELLSLPTSCCLLSSNVMFWTLLWCYHMPILPIVTFSVSDKVNYRAILEGCKWLKQHQYWDPSWLKGSPFLKCVVTICALPVRGGGECKGLPEWFGALFSHVCLGA